MLDFPNSPALNQIFLFWSWDGVKWPAQGGGTPPVPITVPFAGKPADASMVQIPMTVAMVMPAGLAGTTVYFVGLPTAPAVFTVNRISAGVTTLLGTITMNSASHVSATLAGAGGLLSIGDDLQIVAPSPQDATLSDVGITFLTTRV